MEHALGGLSCSVRSLQGDAHLFQFLGEHAAVTLGYAACPSGLLACTSFVLDGHLAIPDLLQALPDGPYGLGVGVIDVADVGPQLPLHPDGLLLGLGLGPDAVPHVFENAGMFLAGVLELILLWRPIWDNSSRARTTFCLLLFEGGFSLFQGGLELFLLHLALMMGPIELVDGFASLSGLVGEVVDLVGEDHAFASETLDVLERIFVS